MKKSIHRHHGLLTMTTQVLLVVVTIGWSASVVEAQSRIVSFFLVNAATDKIIRPLLQNSDTIDLRMTGTALSIASNVTGMTNIQKASFYFNRKFIREEKLSPYSIGSDKGTDYLPFKDLSSSPFCLDKNVTVVFASSNSITTTGTVLLKVTDGSCALVSTKAPTKAPTTKAPTNTPTKAPTKAPTTKAPTNTPTKAPTKAPTTKAPTNTPTKAPTKAPTTTAPTNAPTTKAPTKAPTMAPTKAPTTTAPTNTPTSVPTNLPTLSTSPSSKPSVPEPTPEPTFDPTYSPTIAPTYIPTLVSTNVPTTSPSVIKLALFNADTDTKIRDLVRSEVINLDSVGTRSLTIVATSTIPISKVSFYLDKTLFRNEGTAPYAMAGDSNGNLAPYTLLVSSKLCSTRNVTAIGFTGTSTQVGVATSLIQFVDSTCSVPSPSVPVQPVPVQPAVPVPTIVATPTIPLQPQTTPPVFPPEVTDVKPFPASSVGVVSGELRTWHKVTIGFTGPDTSETSEPNPFTYYRLDVTFVHDSTQIQYVVPGYYAADGNAANSGATSGNVWLVHFAPSDDGIWNWTASFTYGTNVAQDGGGAPVVGFFHGMTGSFTVLPTDKTGKDLRGKGRLDYVGEHYLQFQGTGQYFVKAGADSPENLLAYDDFDNTLNINRRRKSWSPHVQDFGTVPNSPTWRGGKGKGLIGAINYLSNMGMNVFSFLTMNIDGDDKNVFPYLNNTRSFYTRIDVSKTAQWEIIFEHADSIGIFLHFKLQETENDQLLDGGDLGVERKLYYRELIARFGHHLALNWNLGEETTNTDAQLRAFMNYFRAIDPYKHHVVLHTFSGGKQKYYTPLLGNENLTGVSLQTDLILIGTQTREWVTKSATAGHKWVVTNDEQGPASVGVLPDANDIYHDAIRKTVLWANLMNNGGGVEYYFGYNYSNSDVTCQDFRSRHNMWVLSKQALDFLTNYIPFWNMSIATSLIVNGNLNSCMSTNDKSIIVLYLPSGGDETIDLSSVSTVTTYTIDWYDPEIGMATTNPLVKGSIQTIVSGGVRSIGSPPYPYKLRGDGSVIPPFQDWVALIQKSL